MGTAVKQLLDDYQRQTKLNENIKSIDDMQSFLDRYPAFRSKSLNVSKHVALISELSRLVETHSLMDVSQLEQELACHDDGASQRREVLARIGDGRIGGEDKLRLALLYAFAVCVVFNFRAPTPSTRRRPRNCICSMAWRVYAIDATSYNLTHWLISTQSTTFPFASNSRPMSV